MALKQSSKRQLYLPQKKFELFHPVKKAKILIMLIYEGKRKKEKKKASLKESAPKITHEARALGVSVAV
ncbi:MAG: hypothetical protein V1899_03750 [Planctomycetota bacterium]